MSRTALRHDTNSALVPASLDRLRRRRRRLVRHSHSVPSIMLICRLMLRHLNKNCVMSMQQQQQRRQQRRQQRQQQGSSSRGAASSGVALSAAETIVVRQLWIALVGPQRRGNYQRCLHLLPLLLLLLFLLLLRLRWLWARLICVNRVSYASTIMKTLLTCILVELWDEASLYLALSFALSLSLSPFALPPPLYFLPQLTGLLLTTFLLFLLSHTLAHTLAQREFLIEPERQRLLCPFFSCQPGLGLGLFGSSSWASCAMNS